MFIRPDWPAPEGIVAFTTTKLGGISKGDFESLNLSLDVGDDPLDVKKNRKVIEKELQKQLERNAVLNADLTISRDKLRNIELANSSNVKKNLQDFKKIT